MKRTAVVLTLSILPLFVVNFAHAATFNENFDEYTAGSFTGNATWSVAGAVTASVSTTQSVSAPNSLKYDATGGTNFAMWTVASTSVNNATSEGFTAYVYQTNAPVNNSTCYAETYLNLVQGSQSTYGQSLSFCQNGQLKVSYYNSLYGYDSFATLATSTGIAWHQGWNQVFFGYDTSGDPTVYANGITYVLPSSYPFGPSTFNGSVEFQELEENQSTNIVYYDNLQITPGSVVPPVNDTSTRINTLTPATESQLSTTTASTNVYFSAQYFYNASTTEYGSYNSLSLFLNRVDAASSSVYTFAGITQNALESTSTTVVLPSNSSWNIGWCFTNDTGGTGYCTPTQNVYVISNPLPGLIGASTTDNLTGLATSTCSVLNVTGCLQNAMVFLFFPNASVFNNFKTLEGSVKTHAPFGYVFTVLDAINSTNASSSVSFTLDIATSTQTVFFDPLKTALASILWALCAFWFFKRIRDLHL